MSDGHGKIIVISSVSGGGKTSLIRLLKRNHPRLWIAVTATTREPRTGETDGVDYFFYTREQFEETLAAGGFLEHALVHGNYYGVPAEPVYEKLKKGRSVILNIDVQGMRTVRALMGGEVLSIFLLPPDLKVWEDRLRSRGTDSEEGIQRRLAEGHAELKSSVEYDYQIVNDILEVAAGQVSGILTEVGII